MKLDPNGNLLWAHSIGGNNGDRGLSITADGTNVIITGRFEGLVDFNPGPGTKNLNTGSSSDRDIFVLKLNNSGDFQWAKSVGGNNNDIGHSIATDGSNNVYVTGRFKGTTDFNPGPSTYNLTSNGLYDYFVLKLDNTGNFVWAKSIGGNGQDRSYSVKMDATGGVYISGFFTGTVDFDPGSGTNNLVSNGQEDIFIQKLSSSGNLEWVHSMGGNSGDIGFDLATDKTNGVYLTGKYLGTIDVDPASTTQYMSSNGLHDVIVLKLDEQGNLKWAKSVGGSNNEIGRGISINSEKDVYVTGNYYSSADFDPGQGTTILTSNGMQDIFTLQFSQCSKTSSNISKTSCVKYRVPSEDETYYSSGNYTDTITNSGGCDSIINIDLTINQPTDTSIIINACNEYNLPSGDKTVTNSGIYMDTVLNAKGCDSVLTIAVTINDSTSSTINKTVCNSYTVPSDDETYTSSGTYTDTIKNNAGCDSVITINLTVNKKNTGIDTIETCESYHWPASGTTYTSSGTYKDTLTNSVNCDSIVTLHLTINKNTSSYDSVTSCNSYMWPVAGTTYTTGGIYRDTLTNKKNCDSVVTLYLTINAKDSTTQNRTACYQYTWPVNDETYASSGIYMDTLTNTSNCDSIVTLDLTINKVDTSVNQNGATLKANTNGATYQWLDCENDYTPINGETNQSYTASSNGNYAVEVVKNNCADTSSCHQVTGLGIVENAFGDALKVYPNPTSEKVTIDLGEKQKMVNIKLTQITGQVIKEKEVFDTKKVNIIIGEKNRRGMYLIEIEALNTKRALIKVFKK